MKRIYVGAATAAVALAGVSGTASAVQPAPQSPAVVLWNSVVKRNNLTYWNRVIQWNNVVRWNNIVHWNNVMRWNRAMAATPRARPLPQPRATGACGGDLPPCYVMMRESRGSLTARNPYSTASGKWQFLDSTWAGFGGYPRAYLAPESVQDARARQVWANGAGCSAWSAC